MCVTGNDTIVYLDSKLESEKVVEERKQRKNCINVSEWYECDRRHHLDQPAGSACNVRGGLHQGGN